MTVMKERPATQAPAVKMAADTPEAPAELHTLPILPQYSFTYDQREKIIRDAAYLKASLRGFAPGHELEDWLAAEREFECLQ